MLTLAQMLAKDEIFQMLPSREIESLAEQAILRKIQRGEFVCHQGEEWPYAAFISRGELRWAILSLSGREQVLFRIRHGESFWAHTLFDKQPMPGFLTATMPSQIYLWSQAVLTPVLNRNPAVLWALLGRQTSTMRKAREVIYGLAFSPVAGRLARLLLDQSGGQENEPVQREMTLGEIAAIVASSQEVVCRVLYQFQSDELIELNRANFKIIDRVALENLTEKL